MIEGIYKMHPIMAIKWRITYWCNYNCSFCKQKRTAKVPQDIVIERAHKIHDFIINNDIKKTTISLIGGEVMFYDMDAVLEALDFNFSRISITSNFSANIEDYNALIAKYNTLYFQLSFHEEQVGFDAFFDKLEKISDKRRVKVEFVVTDDNTALADKVVERCLKLGVMYSIDDCQTNSGNKSSYSKKKSNRIMTTQVIVEDGKEHYFNSKSECLAYLPKDFSPNGYYCSNSMYNIQINGDDVYGAKCKGMKPIGKLTDNIKRCPILCTSNTMCTMCGNISIDKNRDRLVRILTV